MALVDLNRTEIYALTDALWWAQIKKCGTEHRQEQWAALENKLRKMGYKAGNYDKVADSIRKTLAEKAKKSSA
jgi:hypothetical protein